MYFKTFLFSAMLYTKSAVMFIFFLGEGMEFS